MVSFEVLFQHCLEELWKIKQTLSQNSGSLNQDLEQDITDTKQKCYPFDCDTSRIVIQGEVTEVVY